MRFPRVLLSALLLAAVALAAGFALWRARAEPVDIELVLAVDISGSIDPDEAALQREGYIQAITNPRVMRTIASGYHGKIAMAYVEWAGSHYQSTLVDWMVIDGQQAAYAFAGALAETPIRTQRRTSISTAIDYSARLFADNGFEGERRVIDVSGDGMNNSGRMVAEARDEAVAKDITINGLAIVNGRAGPSGWAQPPGLDRYYDRFVVGGKGAFLVVADRFADFARAVVHKMLREIAAIPSAVDTARLAAPAPRGPGAP